MPEKHRRYFLKAKESKTLLEEASAKLRTDLGLLFKDKVKVEVFETESTEIFLVNRKPLLVKADGDMYPTLKFDAYFHVAPKVVVDMGAIPHICKGANIMAPGIRRFEGEFERDDIVLVVDEKHGKPIALGRILFSSSQVKDVRQGTVVKNVHYVGDKIWSLLREVTSGPMGINS